MTFLVSWLVRRFIAPFGNDTHTYVLCSLENLDGRYYCLFVLAHESTTSRNYRLSFAHSSCVVIFFAGSALFSFLHFRSSPFHPWLFILDRACRDLRIYTDMYMDRVYVPESLITFIPLFHPCMLWPAQTTIKKRWKMPLRYIETKIHFRTEWEFHIFHSFAVFVVNVGSFPVFIFFSLSFRFFFTCFQ